MNSAALYFYSICFCPVVSTQNFRDITKHDFSPVAPSSFVLLQSLSLSLSFIASLKQMAFYAGHNQDYSASGWAALPTCVQPNHNLMNTLGAVCSKLLPVGAKATGNPPNNHTFPLPLHLTSFATVTLPTRPNWYWFQHLDPNSYLLIKSRFISVGCQHSNTAQRLRMSQQAYRLHVGRCRLTANVFICWRWIGSIWYISESCFSRCV